MDRYILIAKQRTSKVAQENFDWSLIPEHLKHKIILAGGISPNNVEQAIQQNCLGLDLNSGVESSSGVKDQEKCG